ncbi:MAG TPA: tryptophan 2,3-dioxygenase family protein [Blastocatellia bacterium]|nr:tryptophan 2,3-dioxygenase family protein [Blastocatellia bacterium]
MSFGLPPRDEPRLTYGGYLKLNDLTSLQHLLSDPPQHDEMLFIIIHQVYELWFKELLHELDTIIERLDGDLPLAAHRLVRRCIEIERVLVDQIAVLETMMPTDFLAFRDHLMPASGFQSFQFRELEYVSGLKDSRFLKNYEATSPEYARLEARLNRPSVADAYYSMLRRRGFNLPEIGVGSEQNREVVERARINELERVYQDAERHYELFLLTESLIEYDEMFAMWRLRHVKMVERMIGSKTGTGGSEGAAYLKRTVDRKFFPELWELRSYLSKKSGGY